MLLGLFTPRVVGWRKSTSAPRSYRGYTGVATGDVWVMPPSLGGGQPPWSCNFTPHLNLLSAHYTRADSCEMGEVAGNISATGTKSGPPIGPPEFQRASEVLRASSAALPGPSSVRDASNGTASAQPSSNGLGEGEQSSHASGSATNDTAPPVNAVKKPINRPATSKNAIVYNAVQVSHGNARAWS